MKTRDEIENLKNQWAADPCWEIEDAEGFEEHREELRAFSEQNKRERTEAAAKLEREKEERFKNLKLHEHMTIKSGVWVFKVKSGWVYGFQQEDTDVYDHVFVPYLAQSPVI